MRAIVPAGLFVCAGFVLGACGDDKGGNETPATEATSAATTGDGDGDGEGTGDGNVPHCASIEATDVAATAAFSLVMPLASPSRKRAKKPSGPSLNNGPCTFRSCPAPASETNAFGVCARA